MRVPDQGFGPARLLDVFGLYHLSRLRADPETADLVASFTTAQDSLRRRLDEQREVDVAAMTALAGRDAKDDTLDDALRAFYFLLLQKVVNNRKDPIFLRYFADGMSEVLLEPPDEKLRTAGILLSKLDQETEADLRAHTPAIRAATDALEAAVTAYEKASDAERLGFERVQEEKLRWIDAYKHSHRQIQLRFYKDPRRAERYFRSARRGAPVEEGQPAVAVLEAKATVGEVAGEGA